MKAKNTDYIRVCARARVKAPLQRPSLAGLPMGDGFPMSIPVGIGGSVGSSDFTFLAYDY